MDDRNKQPVSENVEKDAVIAVDTDKVEKEPDPLGLDPTRFGDWEKNGRCIDF